MDSAVSCLGASESLLHLPLREAFFRGFLLRELSEVGSHRQRAALIALVVSALLFGLLHLVGGWKYALAATIAGAGYGLAYLRTQRVEAGMAGTFRAQRHSLPLVHLPGTGMNETEIVERPLGVLIHSAINAAVAVAFGIRLPWAIKSFQEMFAAFGSELGAPTRLVLATPYLWLLFALVSVALLVWVASPSRISPAELRRKKFAVRGFTLAFGLTLAFTAWALYAPIFKMSETV